MNKVSIIIPYYNLGKYVKRTVISAINQTYKNIEIILVNDGTNDIRSIKALSELKRSYSNKVIFIDQKNQGLSAARNNGIKQSTGIYICCLDADDIIESEYIEKLLAIICKSRNIGIVSSWVKIFGKENYIWETFPIKPETALIKNSLCVSSLFRKECWDMVGGYDEKMKDGYEDWDLWIAISKRGYISKIYPHPIFNYRVRKNSMLSSANLKRIQILKYMHDKHKDLLKKYYSETLIEAEHDLIFQRNELIKYKTKVNKLIDINRKIIRKSVLEKTTQNDLDYIYDKYADLKKKQNEIEMSLSWRFITFIRTKILDKFTSNRASLRKKITNPIRTISYKIKVLSNSINKLRPTIALNHVQAPYTTNRPLVSIIIVCYNYGQYVPEAVNSVLNQTFQDFEIIIVESNSVDNSKEVIEKLNDNRIKKYFRQERHLAGDNRNFGIEKAKGKYICCLDADDMIKATYLEKAVFLLETENHDLVSTSIQTFGDSEKTYIQIPNPTLDNMTLANHIATVAVFKKDLYLKTGGYHDFGTCENYVYEDWDLWVRMSALGARFYNIYEPLMLYRLHGINSLSGNTYNMSFEEQRQKILTNNSKYLTRYNFIKSKIRNKLIKYTVHNKFVNLSRDKSKEKILFALPFTALGGADNIFLNLVSLFNKNMISSCITTTVNFDNTLHDTTDQYEKTTNCIYHLPRFLIDANSQKSYIDYLIIKSDIQVIFIGGSKLYYDLLPYIKTKHPQVKVIDIQFNTDVHFKNCLKYIQYIDHIIAENQEVYDKYTTEYKISKDKVSLISYGVETSKFVPIINSEMPKDIPKNKFIISFLGRQSPEKNPEFIIKLAEKYKKNNKLFFILAGPGQLFESLRERVKKLGLTNIHMPGSINSLEYLSFTDLLILPSIIDGNPIVIKEAFSMGIPVIASNVGGIPYLVKNNETGFICDINSLPQFSQAINKIVSSPKLLQKMKENCREYAVKNLDLKIVNEKFLTVFNKYIK